MTSEPDAYVWVWLPGQPEPVVAGGLARTDRSLAGETVLAYTYGRSYLQRPDALSLFSPELPLRDTTFDPADPLPNRDWRGYSPSDGRRPLPLAGCLRDAAPDAWGRRVLNASVAANPDSDLGELTYLLESGSDRIGAIDFQRSPAEYAPRSEPATLAQLARAAELIEAGEPLPDDLLAAAGHATSVGGARPKALLSDGGRHWIAKFSSSTDDRPVVKAEAVGMLLAARVGLDVAPVAVTQSAGLDVLLVERFDRTADGRRLMVVSALTVLGLDELSARYSSYAELASAIRFAGWPEPAAQMRELFTRMVLNIAVSNTDDHLRNHAAFWDGTELSLTPAFDVAPQRRSTSVATHAIGLSADGERSSQFRVARKAARSFGITDADAASIIDNVQHTIHSCWKEVCDEARLSKSERTQLWRREILPEYASWDQT